MNAQIHHLASSDQSLTPSLHELEANIINLAHRINAAEYEFLVAVAEFDIRQGWKAYHLNNCAEWLNLRCGIVPATAREKIRTANALRDLPKISAAFKQGTLSYSNVRALTRVAKPETEQGLVAFASNRTALQVEEHCRRLRNIMRAESERDAETIFRNRFLSYTILPDGGVAIHLELPLEDGELILKAIELAAHENRQNNTHTGDELNTFTQQRADALVDVARQYLAGGTDKKGSPADHYQVVVHVDQSALLQSGTDNSSAGRDKRVSSDLPLETIRRLTCDSSLVTVLEDDNGNPLNVGRKKRVVSPLLKRALISRDQHCRFPRCTHNKWLEAHHVTHWINGGVTSIDNLMLICSRHHRLLHEGGFAIHVDDNGNQYFKTHHGRILNDPASSNIQEPQGKYWAGGATIG